MHVLSLQDVSGWDPILEREPKKDFVLHLTFGPPNPMKGWVHLSMPNKSFVSFSGRESRIAPNIGPLIRSGCQLNAINQRLES
jgi:hypothetical protein